MFAYISHVIPVPGSNDSNSSISAPGAVVIPTGEKRTFVSELFSALVLDKAVQSGFTRDRYTLTVELLEQDPNVVRTATVEVIERDWRDVDRGDRVLIRLYQHADKTWTPIIPDIPPATG